MLIKILTDHLIKKAAQIAQHYKTTPENIKICWQKGVFTYQVIIDGNLIDEKTFNI